MSFVASLSSAMVPDKHFFCPDMVRKNGLTYELKNGKIDIYLSGDHESGDKLSSLSTPVNITSFLVSDEAVIVTTSEDGIRQWKLKNIKDMGTIINVD